MPIARIMLEAWSEALPDLTKPDIVGHQASTLDPGIAGNLREAHDPVQPSSPGVASVFTGIDAPAPGMMSTIAELVGISLGKSHTVCAAAALKASRNFGGFNGLAGDLPPAGPAVITRVCRFDIRAAPPAQARRA